MTRPKWRRRADGVHVLEAGGDVVATVARGYRKSGAGARPCWWAKVRGSGRAFDTAREAKAAALVLVAQKAAALAPFDASTRATFRRLAGEARAARKAEGR